MHCKSIRKNRAQRTRLQVAFQFSKGHASRWGDPTLFIKIATLAQAAILNSRIKRAKIRKMKSELIGLPPVTSAREGTLKPEPQRSMKSKVQKIREQAFKLVFVRAVANGDKAMLMEFCARFGVTLDTKWCLDAINQDPTIASVVKLRRDFDELQRKTMMHFVAAANGGVTEIPPGAITVQPKADYPDDPKRALREDYVKSLPQPRPKLSIIIPNGKS